MRSKTVGPTQHVRTHRLHGVESASFVEPVVRQCLFADAVAYPKWFVAFDSWRRMNGRH